MYNYGIRNSELKIKEADQPLDTVRQIIWNPYLSTPCFITAGWDAIVRLYQITNNDVEKNWEIYLHHPVLSIDVN